MSELNEKELLNRLEAISQLAPAPSAVARDLQRVRQTINQPTRTRPVREQNIWRIIMKTKLTKIAAVLIIAAGIVAVSSLFIKTSSTIAFADVVKPILNARTAILDIHIGSGKNQPVIHDEIMGSRIRRTVSNVQGTDTIIDLEQMKILALTHAEKTAVYVNLDGLGNLQNYLELLRDTVARMQDKAEYQVENRGLQQIEGKDYIVFVAESEKETITIWADPKTALPVRIEQKTPNMQIACDNLQFDIPLDESLFSMEVPDGYVIQAAGGIDFKKSSESDFIETLRIWAQIIEDGQFPDSINLEDIVKIGPKFDQGLKRANLTKQQETEIALRWGQGLVFIRFFKGQGKWHYAGKGVTLGDSQTPIFWYQPKDSPTWRVIYGDLRVEDVAPENLPQ